MKRPRMDLLVQDPSRLFEYLTSVGGSPNSEVDSVTGYRLMHAVVKADRLDSLRRLLEVGADLLVRAKNGDTPLHVCAQEGRIACMRLLLDRSIDPNVVNYAKETPLHQAVAAEQLEAVRELLKRGADSTREDVYKDNALHVACFEENSQTIKMLLDADPSLINRQNGGGSTPLHIAAVRENPEILSQLLKYGADFTLTEGLARTTVDLLTENGDTSCIDSLGRHVIGDLRKFMTGEDIVKIVTSHEGETYLDRLLHIDGLCFTAGSVSPTEENKQLEMSNVESIITQRKVDAERLIAELDAACKMGLRLDLENSGLLARSSWKIVQLVLFPQNEILLKRLMTNRSLWSSLSRHIELTIDKLYAKALCKKKAGVRELLRRNCTDSTGIAIDFVKLNKFLATLTNYWSFRRRRLMFDTDTNCMTNAHRSCHKRPMRDPLQTVVLWAILTGRLKLVPTLLREEQFDLVPLALLCATVLRSLSNRRDIEDVFVDKANRVADICEGMAIQVIKEVKEVDNSPNNSLTISYVSLPLPNYADYNILDLSARGCAREFIKLDIVELATDKNWYGDFFNFTSSLMRELVIVSGLIPPLMLLLPRLIKRYRQPGTRRFLETVLNDPASPSAASGEKDEKEEKSAPESVNLLSVKENTVGKDGDVAWRPHRHGFVLRSVEYFKEMLHFYQTPCVKFRIHAIFYFVFVGLLSKMILHDFKDSPKATEIFCYFTLLGIFVEELREMISARQEETLLTYLSDGWNVLDLVAITCGFGAFVARQFPSSIQQIYSSGQGKWVRDLSYILIVCTTLIFWIRILFISIVLESVGVKLKMLSLMVKKDFIPFLYILVVIMLGFGIAFHALLWPHGQKIVNGKPEPLPALEIFIEMFHRTFYTIVGEYGIDNLQNVCKRNFTEDSDDSSEPDKCVDSTGSYLVPYVFMVAYIVIVQVLLLNVIVAMFSKTIDMVDSESKSLWLFERYDLNKEFFKRSALPAPLNIGLEVRNLMFWLLRKLGIMRCLNRGRKSMVETMALNQRNFVYLFYLFYQAVTLRKLRSKLDGVGLEADDFSQEGAVFNRQLDDLKNQQQHVINWLDEQSEELRQQRELLEQLLAGMPRKKSTVF